MTSPKSKKGPLAQDRLYWHSRRGMLELELRLVPFIKNNYANLNEAEKETYRQILEREDWQIFDWLQGVETPTDPAIAEMITLIRTLRVQPL